jgi:hypothetical protein
VRRGRAQDELGDARATPAAAEQRGGKEGAASNRCSGGWELSDEEGAALVR